MVISDEQSLAAEAAAHMSKVVGCKVHTLPPRAMSIASMVSSKNLLCKCRPRGVR